MPRGDTIATFDGKWLSPNGRLDVILPSIAALLEIERAYPVLQLVVS